MSDEQTEQQKQQEQVLHVVRARLQVVEDQLMAGGWELITVRTKHGVFEWTRGAVEEPSAQASPQGTRRP